MSTPTPWQVDETISRYADDDLVREVTVTRFDLRSGWWYLATAALGLVTLLLMFQPWLTATGPIGTVRVDAFGRLVDWPKAYGRREANISGVWALLATAAVVLTMATVLLRLWIPVRSLSRLVLASATAAAAFVIADRYYLADKASELRALTERSDILDGSLTDLLDTVLTGDSNATRVQGDSSAAVAGFEIAATLSCGAAIATVFAALLTVTRFPGKSVGTVRSSMHARIERELREDAHRAPGGSGNRKSGNRIDVPMIISASMDPSVYSKPRTKTRVPGTTSDTVSPPRRNTRVSSLV